MLRKFVTVSSLTWKMAVYSVGLILQQLQLAWFGWDGQIKIFDCVISFRTKDESCYEYVPPDKTYFLEIVVFVFGVMPRDMELEIVLQLESEVQKVVMGYVNDDSRLVYWP